VRIGVGHPGSKDAVAHYVLRDFAKAEHAWLDPMLDAMAEAVPYLAKGDSARFLSQVALRAREEDEPEPEAPQPKAKPAPRNPHPAGERQSKRANALAENLKKWLGGRGDKE